MCLFMCVYVCMYVCLCACHGKLVEVRGQLGVNSVFALCGFQGSNIGGPAWWQIPLPPSHRPLSWLCNTKSGQVVSEPQVPHFPNKEAGDSTVDGLRMQGANVL